MIRKIYSKARNIAPVKLNGISNRLLFNLRNRPVVHFDSIVPGTKFPGGAQGGVIISADFEMAWAWRYTKTKAAYLEKGRRERTNMDKILKLLETYKIPVTFATVGHLLLENCKKGDHDWMKRIPHFDDHWRFTNGDWFDHDPYSDYLTDPVWYAPDLIRKITDSVVGHEIAVHTFSHIDFSYKNCPPDVAHDEIRAFFNAAKAFDVTPESMVFPGGTWGNIEVLKKSGILIYRKKGNYDLSYIQRDEYGLLVTNSSASLEYNRGYGWSPDYYLRRLESFVDKAIETSTIAHFWFHPSLDPWFLDNLFPGLFNYLDRRKSNGDLWVGTMKDIARHININKLM